MTLTAVPAPASDTAGTDVLIGTVVNPAGLTLAKSVPISRAPAFVDPGLGTSPTWHGFAIDQSGIAFTDAISVVGDQRVRIDPTAARPLDEGEAWCDRCDGVRALDLNGHCMDCGAKVSGVLHERPAREEWTETDDGSLVREPQRESARGRVTWEAPCARCGEETLHTATGGCALCAERRENRLHGLLYLVFGVLGLFLFRWPGPALRRGLRAVIAGTDPEAD